MAHGRPDTVEAADLGYLRRLYADPSATHRARRLTAALLCAAVAVTIVLLAAAHSRRVTVNGQGVPMLGRLTVTDCARRLDVPLQPGDLVDVSGAVLQTGGGRPPVFRVNNALASADQRVHCGDIVEIAPAGDLTEPVQQTARFITPVAVTTKGPKPMPWLTETGVGGIKYVYRGEISGKVQAVQLAAVTPAHGGIAGRPKRVALTFDDGPSAHYTPQILKILAEHKARATFFVLGCWAAKYPQLVKDIVAGGNEVGCHTWSHPNCTNLSADALRGQVRRWEAVVNPLVGGQVRYFRPPYGAVNARVRQVVNGMGYSVVLWSGDTNDWRRPGSNAIYSRAMAAARDGANILMHDGGGPRDQTAAAVKRLVPDLQARGYQLVTLSELHGTAEPWAGEFIIHTETGDLKLTPGDKRLTVMINGRRAELPITPVEIEGQLLLPARPPLDMLGCTVRYDKSAQHLHIGAPTLSLEMDLNRSMMQLGSEEVWMAVPPVLYKGYSMVPLWILMDYCGADATYDPMTKTLYLSSKYGSSARPVRGSDRYSVALGRAPHINISEDTLWHEKLARTF